VIENAMIEINAEVRGGIITTEPVLFPDSRTSGMNELISPLLEEGKDRCPQVNDRRWTNYLTRQY
jgi:hypothetical protein